jgi:uncharacterized phiE125 gp8 family phage protein
MALRQITAPTVEPVTLAEAKTHLRESLDDADNDAYIEALITTARETAEDRANRSFMLQTLELTLDAFPTSIRLDRAPVLAVSLLEYMDADTGSYVTLSTDSYTVDSASEPGWIVPAYGYSWPTPRCAINAVKVTYTAGYSDSGTAATARAAVPKTVRQWILLMIGSLYRHRSIEVTGANVSELQYADDMIDRYRIWTF